ncbi:MAG: hypothetical protein ACLFOZ_10810 [Cyclobacteriaceae bacterium]
MPVYPVCHERFAYLLGGEGSQYAQQSWNGISRVLANNHYPLALSDAMQY